MAIAVIPKSPYARRRAYEIAIHMDVAFRKWAAMAVVIALAAVLVYLVLSRPNENAAPPSYSAHRPISIVGDAGFNSTNGVVSGSGRSGDPYIIEGWEIGPTNSSVCVSILNSDAHFTIRHVHLSHAAKGVFFSGVINGRLEHSIIDNQSVGVTIYESDTCAIVGNTIRDNGIGIQVMESTNLRIRDNHNVNNGINVQKPSLPWGETWIGTAVCVVVIVPLVLIVVFATYFRYKLRKEGKI